MQKFFDDTPSAPSIIAREEVLLPIYQPDELRYRGNELQVMADAVKPLLRKRQPVNLLIHGNSGTGKTTCAKAIMRQLSEHSSAVLPVYANCWESPTRAAVFGKIIEAMRLPLPRRGLAVDELFDRLLQYAKSYSRPVLLVLDELDGLEEQELLYSVARANERPGVLFGIIGITNNSEFLAKLDPRVRSSLRFSELTFPEYSEEQLFWILKDRAIAGLAPNTWDDKLLTKIARSVDDGSARIALSKLWKAARHAEDLDRLKITLQDLADSEAETEQARPGAALTDMELKIVEQLRTGDKTTDELYALLNFDKTKRMFMNHLARLEEKRIIEMEAQPGNGKFGPKVCRLASTA